MKEKKMSQADFEIRFKRIFPKDDITILEYNGCERSFSVKCNKCGKESHFSRANMVFHLVNFCKCEKTFKDFHEKLKYLGEEFDFTILEEHKATENQIIKCNKCGTIMKRKHVSILATPWHCDTCNNFAKGRYLYSKEEAQLKLDEKKKEYQLLEYSGQNGKALIKHLNCGKIFTVSCLQDMFNGKNRGCPVCYQMKSVGEQRIMNFLDKNNINYIPQKTFAPLNKSKYRFDFYIPELNWVIEYQGEQHFKDNNFFRDDLNVIQKRDQIKREYCKENGIKLFEISYKDLKKIDKILTSMFNDYLDREQI